jgi:hypothetical protein
VVRFAYSNPKSVGGRVFLLSHSFITNTFRVNWGDHCVCVPLIEGATRSGIAGGGRNGSAHNGRQNQRGGKMNVLKKKKRSLL